MLRDRTPRKWSGAIAVMLAAACFTHPADAGPGPILRLRGGPSWEDNHNYTGPAWFAGASAGVQINRSVLVTVGADRINLDGFRVATPVLLQFDVGRPFRDGVRPSVLAGVGTWYVQVVRTVDVDFWGGPLWHPSRTTALLGGYLGGGVSFPITRFVAFDTALRYQLAHNEYGTLHLITTDAGFTFRL